MSSKPYDFAVVGAGIVGLSTAFRLLSEGRSVVVLEAEAAPGRHQTEHNSGVIHSGLYYRPGSLKASLCVSGRRALLDLCERREIPHEVCGKLVVATSDVEQGRLDELHRRGSANGLAGLRRLSAGELREYEPNVAGQAGLWVPETGIVDYSAVAAALSDEIRERGGELRVGAPVAHVRSQPEGVEVSTLSETIEARRLIACAGLQSDRVARSCGIDPGVRIVPFRGEYLRLAPGREGLVRNLIYPVADPRFPFLGVHFTRKIGGGIEVGPNAVLALHRAGYRRGAVSLRDAASSLGYAGFWRLASRYWKVGMGEFYRSISRRATAAALRRLVPEIRAGDLIREGAGVRAQAVTPAGDLIDDFHLVKSERMLHVINAPSPAATACLSIADEILRRAGVIGLPR